MFSFSVQAASPGNQSELIVCVQSSLTIPSVNLFVFSRVRIQLLCKIEEFSIYRDGGGSSHSDTLHVSLEVSKDVLINRNKERKQAKNI